MAEPTSGLVLYHMHQIFQLATHLTYLKLTLLKEYPPSLTRDEMVNRIDAALNVLEAPSASLDPKAGNDQ